MALHQPTLGQQIVADLDLVRVLVIAVAAIGLVLVLTAIFGVQDVGSWYKIVPDPAGLTAPF
jgi:hypothetical protein